MADETPIEGEVVEVEVVERKATVVTNRAEALLAQVEQMGPIANDEQDAQQKELQAAIKAALKDWDEERHDLTDPLEKTKKKIIARYNAAAEPAAQALGILNEHIKAYFLKKQEAARREQRRLDSLARARQERAEERAEKKGEEAPVPIIPLPTVAAPAKTTHTTQGRVTVSEYWTWKYITTQEDAVKAAVDSGRLDLLLFNEKAAGAMVRAGVRSIPGCDVYQDVKV